MDYRSIKLYTQNYSLKSKFNHSHIFFICQMKPMSCKEQVRLKHEFNPINVSFRYISNQSVKKLGIFSKIKNKSFYNLFQGNLANISIPLKSDFSNVKVTLKKIKEKKINIIGVFIQGRFVCPFYFKTFINTGNQRNFINILLNTKNILFYTQLKSEPYKFMKIIKTPLHKIIDILNILQIKKNEKSI
uniref:Ribosomal protein L10 n=1 Tax=Proteomonas sulcata TaxID=77928 RepID=A0A2P1G8D4_9CRYP|nr:hypothetical protein PsulMt_p034 [Proteomonas sulcata]AVM81210.1 hypothetical protein PsulMt_p034 [Proteomonas sulcata]